MRAVVDVNVLVSAVLSSRGAAAEILRRCRDGQFELIVSELLLTELARTLAYPKIRKRVGADTVAALLGWLRDHATVAEDPAGSAPAVSPDPDDDYLIALAMARRAYLVSSGKHLLGLSGELPIHAPAAFIALLDQPT